MALPPFPCQDLAKLVLGYLAEEDLMTAYDEFLHESPCLDAMWNEYDRVMMPSLKKILAEYRAVKIFLTTCKPLPLRRRLNSCPNLVEVLKILVENADLSKLPSDSVNRSRCDHLMSKDLSARDTCDSSHLHCLCKNRQSQLSSNDNTQDCALDSSVNTALLKDLPGDCRTTKKRKIRTLERERELYNPLRSVEQVSQIHDGMRIPSDQGRTWSQNLSQCSDQATICDESNIRVAETNVTVFNQASKPSTGYVSTVPVCNVYPERQLRSSGTPQDLYRTVAAGGSHITNDVNISGNSSATPNASENAENTSTLKEVTTAHLQFKYGTVSNKSSTPFTYPGKVKPKSAERKIMILSDIKVDKQLVDTPNTMPEVLRKAPTPGMQMQTILINGTPAFRQVHDQNDNLNYTKDEIMAMPTIILVSSSDSVTTMASAQVQTSVPATNTTTTSATHLGPLLIDVSNETGNNNKMVVTDSNTASLNFSDNSVIPKAIQGKNLSLPKDNIILTDSTSKSTPQVAPPVRKSSSTPRRNSHIRVLDFATPRRILEDAIEEHGEIADDNTNEVIVSGSPSLHKFIKAASTTNGRTNIETQDSKNAGMGSTANLETNDPKKNNWDAKLRALAVSNNDGFVKTIPICQQRKKKSSNKKGTKLSDKKKTPNKSKKRKSDEVIAVPITNVPDLVIPVKPTINIVPAPDWGLSDTKQSQKDQNKSNDEPSDTPDLDKTSLQNVIGSKLNISDLLETPYKQALYDIQMETPRFLDFPGEPLSDIKIASIPTPRFMDTPKPPQATPSYSSRATDYSSGGSYYKPDDQDCLALDELGYPPKSTQNPKKLEENTEDVLTTCATRSRRSSTRPIRKCAKNVNYRNSPTVPKSKEEKSKSVFENKNETISSGSDTNNSSCEFETLNENRKTKSSKSKRLSDKASRIRYSKSPAKKPTPKSFMKIKPRRPNPSKKSRKTPESKSRRRTNSKDQSGNVAVAIICKPTKSRRKSSTPRKLQCTNSDNYPLDSPDHAGTDNNPLAHNVLDKPVRFPEIEAQNDSSEKQDRNSSAVNESEDISKIKEFIATSETPQTLVVERSLHVDLVKRGFDEETAKIIERDLLDTPTHPGSIDVVNVDTDRKCEESNKTDGTLEKTLESSTASNSLQIAQVEENDDDSDDPEWSVYRCDEQSENYITCTYDETQHITKKPPVTLKDNYSMEVCFEDEKEVKLVPTSLILLIDENSTDVQQIDYSYKETEIAVSSISNIDKLYTPLKDQIKATCYDIFDSTLTSLDTPLKATSPRYLEQETAVTEIVLQVEKVDDKGKQTKKKRRRISSDGSTEEKEADSKKAKRVSDDNVNDNKTKSETPYLLNPANIKKIDIESVLCRLHGP